MLSLDFLSTRECTLMTPRFRLFYFVFAMLIAVCAMPQAHAKSISLREAINTVQAQYPGKVLKTGQVNIKQNKYYRIKLVTKKGRVISVLVNVDTGKIRKE